MDLSSISGIDGTEGNRHEERVRGVNRGLWYIILRSVLVVSREIARSLSCDDGAVEREGLLQIWREGLIQFGKDRNRTVRTYKLSLYLCLFRL